MSKREPIKTTKEAIISYDRELSNIELRKAVEDAGYEVISLS